MKTAKDIECGVYWDKKPEKRKTPKEKTKAGIKREKSGYYFVIKNQNPEYNLKFENYQADILIYLCQNSDRRVESNEILRALDLSDTSKLVSQQIPLIVAKIANLPGVGYEFLARSTPKAEPLNTMLPKQGRWRISTGEGEFVFEYTHGEMRAYSSRVDPIRLAQSLLKKAFGETLSEYDDLLLARTLNGLDLEQVIEVVAAALRSTGDGSSTGDGGEFEMGTVCRVLDKGNGASGLALSKKWDRCQFLHQLPPCSSLFAGRDEELLELSALPSIDGVRYVALRGMPGVGKTTLAVALANKWMPAYRDAQLFLDARGSRHETRTPEQLLAKAVLAFSPHLRPLIDETKLQESRDELVGMYREYLDKKKALILVDNVRSADQVKLLMPPPGSALIVVTRELFVLRGTAPHLIGKLSDVKAVEVLRKIYAPLTQEDAESLIGFCGGLPLVLKIVGTGLILEASKRGGIADVAKLRKELKNARLETLERHAGKSEDVTVSASLRWSEENLTASEREAWWKLSLFPAGFDAKAGAAVTGAGLDICETLAERSLLEIDGERYSFHDLVREFALARLQSDDELYHEAGYQHSKHYLDVMKETNRLHKEGGGAVMDALALLDREWLNIEAGQEWARENTGRDERAVKMTIDYPTAGSLSLDLRQHPRTQIEWMEDSLSGSSQLKNPEPADIVNRYITYHNIGLAHSNMGEMPEAIENYQRSLALMEEIGNYSHQVKCLANCGWPYYKLGNKREALDLYERGLKLAEEITDEVQRDRARIDVWTNLGICYKDGKDYARALEIYRDALAATRRVEDPRAEGKVWGSIGIIHDLKGDFDVAISHYETQLAIAEKMGDLRSKANALNNIAFSLIKKGQTREAVPLAQEALDLYRSLSDPMENDVLDTLKECYLALEKENGIPSEVKSNS